MPKFPEYLSALDVLRRGEAVPPELEEAAQELDRRHLHQSEPTDYPDYLEQGIHGAEMRSAEDIDFPGFK